MAHVAEAPHSSTKSEHGEGFSGKVVESLEGLVEHGTEMIHEAGTENMLHFVESLEEFAPGISKKSGGNDHGGGH